MECNHAVHSSSVHHRDEDRRTEVFSFLWPRLVPNRTKVNYQFVGMHPFRKYTSKMQTRRIRDERQDDFETYWSRPHPSPNATQYESDPSSQSTAAISISIIIEPHSYRDSGTHQ